MEFDFHQQYKSYSNVELLKIIKQPSEYQPDAVAIAKQILDEREVTIEETESADQYILGIENSVKAKKEKIEAFKNKATDFFEPVLQPGETVHPAKWVNILLLIITVQYAWSLFEIIKRLVSFIGCSYCSIDFTVLAEVFVLLYVPVIFFLLFKRNRWGWILLFADNLFGFIARIFEAYQFHSYRSLDQADATSFFFPLFIKAAFLLFL